MKIYIFSLLIAVTGFSNVALADSFNIVSDASVNVVGVYNKSTNLYVDLSSNPRPAVLAAEPVPYPTTYIVQGLDSVWDIGTNRYFQNISPTADWIWETEKAEDPKDYNSDSPLYDPTAYTNGRVVVFEKKFNINGTPKDSVLHIAADNAWEISVNGTYIARSSTIFNNDWKTSDLHENSVSTYNWQQVNDVLIPASTLKQGENVITIVAGNEYFANDDGNNPTPAYNVNPYYEYNPGALIFKFDVEFDPIVSSGCTFTQGYWKNHESSWLTNSLNLGNIVYNQSQLLKIFNTAPKGDDLFILAHQLIAAKLNILAGANPASVSVVISNADNIINNVNLNLGTQKNRKINTANNLAGILDQFNNGVIGPGHCK